MLSKETVEAMDKDNLLKEVRAGVGILFVSSKINELDRLHAFSIKRLCGILGCGLIMTVADANRVRGRRAPRELTAFIE